MINNVQAFINEKSFDSPVANRFVATENMQLVDDVLRALRENVRLERVLTHSNFGRVRIAADFSISDWIKTLRDEVVRGFYFQLIVNGPFVDAVLAEECKDHTCSYVGKDARHSSLAGAAFFKPDSALDCHS